MFLICLKADLPVREEKTDLIHPVSIPRLEKNILIYLLCDTQTSLSSPTNHPIVQPPGCMLKCMLHLRNTELSMVKWMKHRKDGESLNYFLTTGKDVTSGEENKSAMSKREDKYDR